MPAFPPAISIVVPVYNSASIIPELVTRVDNAMDSVSLAYELILCDDQSKDNSWQVIKGFCASDKRIIGLRMSENCGQWFSTLAGMSKTSAKYIVTMDDDLEYEPSDILKLYSNITSNNYQVVFGMSHDKYPKQGKNEHVSAWRNKILNLFWRKGPTDSFKIIDRNLVFKGETFLPAIPFEAYIAQNLDRSLWGYIQVGFSKRYSGQSNHSFFKKLGLLFLFSSFYYSNPVRYAAFFSATFLSSIFIVLGLLGDFSLLGRLFTCLAALLILFVAKKMFLQPKRIQQLHIGEELNVQHVLLK